MKPNLKNVQNMHNPTLNMLFKLAKKKKIMKIYYCGAKGPNHMLGLGLWPRIEQSEDEWMVMNGSGLGPNEGNTDGRMV